MAQVADVVGIVETVVRRNKKVRNSHLLTKMEDDDDGVLTIGGSQPPLSSQHLEESDTLVPIEDGDTEAEWHRYKSLNCCELHCCGGLQNMACGWPKGTVRAIIAVGLLTVVLGVEAFLVIWLAIDGDKTSALAISGALLAQLGGVTGFYYGTRSGAKKETGDDEALYELERRRRL